MNLLQRDARAHPRWNKVRCCLCFISIKLGDQVLQFAKWDDGPVPDCETADCPSILHARCAVERIAAEARLHEAAPLLQ